MLKYGGTPSVWHFGTFQIEVAEMAEGGRDGVPGKTVSYEAEELQSCEHFCYLE
jgi:hypothetical protein